MSASPTDAFGVTSTSAPLRRVLVRRPATSGDWLGAGWREPDPVALARQHEALRELLGVSAPKWRWRPRSTGTAPLLRG